MFKKQEKVTDGYQAKQDIPLKNPPVGGSNVKPPPSTSKKESNNR